MLLLSLCTDLVPVYLAHYGAVIDGQECMDTKTIVDAGSQKIV